MHPRRFAGSALASLVLIGLTAPSPLAATDLAGLIPGVFDQEIDLTSNFHDPHFTGEAAKLLQIGNLINESLLAQLTTFPIGSSAGGFTYSYDANLGVYTRTSSSFGPIFGERTQTLGRGKWNAGFSYQASDYDEIGDLELDSGDLSFPLLHRDDGLDGRLQPAFEGDIIQATARISLETKTSVLFASYGVSDRLDLGLAVPIISVDLDAESQLDINRLATGATSPTHTFANGTTRQSELSSGSANGVGDIVLRGKYRFGGDPASGFAAAVDLRLPTGAEEDLLGSGATQVKLLLVASTQRGNFSPHGNLGYTVSSGGGDAVGDLPNEINYSAGFDWAAHPKLTLAVDAVGRYLQDAETVVGKTRTLSFTAPGGGVQSAQVADLDARQDDLNLLLGSAGLRWNPVGNLLISLNALFSLSNDGLRDSSVVPLIGIDYSF